MRWNIINITKHPVCDFCKGISDQMAQFEASYIEKPIWICSDCARYVKDCVNKWEGLLPLDYIPDNFTSTYVDRLF